MRRVTRSYDDYALFPGPVIAFNQTNLTANEGEISVANLKANSLKVTTGSGNVGIATSKAHLTTVSTASGEVALSGSAMPRDYGRGGIVRHFLPSPLVRSPALTGAAPALCSSVNRVSMSCSMWVRSCAVTSLVSPSRERWEAEVVS